MSSFASITAYSFPSYDRCNDLLRDGVRDELAENNSKKHQLVKHQQFCSMAKEYQLSEANVES